MKNTFWNFVSENKNKDFTTSRGLHIKPLDGLERQSRLFGIFIAQPQLPGTKASRQHFCVLLLASIIKPSILIAKVLLEVGLISWIVGSLVKASRSEEVQHSDSQDPPVS